MQLILLFDYPICAKKNKDDNFHSKELNTIESSASKVATWSLFDKKSKCNDIQSELSTKLNDNQKIIEIFYSKKIDSCVVYLQLKYWYQLIDGLTWEYIVWVDMTKDDETVLQSMQIFQAKWKELKSE